MAIAVCVSSVFALTLTPMLGSRVLTGRQGRDPVSRVLGRGLDALDRFYQAVLRRALGHRLVTLAVAVVAMAGGVLVARTLPFDLFVTEDRSEFNVELKMPIGTPLGVTAEAARRAEEVLAADPEVRNRFATIGGGSRQEPNRASIYVQLTNKRERDLGQLAIMDRVREQFARPSPGSRGDRRVADQLDRGQRRPVGGARRHLQPARPADGGPGVLLGTACWG